MLEGHGIMTGKHVDWDLAHGLRLVGEGHPRPKKVTWPLPRLVLQWQGLGFDFSADKSNGIVVDIIEVR